MKNRLDFFGIGVQKSATSWIFKVLEDHPGIRCAERSENKELNFFNHHFDKGYLFYHKGFEFGSWKTGEFSTLYFYDKNVPKRMFDYNPDAKLIVSFRNPADRAYSQHLHEIKQGRVPRHLYRFSDALQYNPSYLEMGKYASHIEHYLYYFSPDNIHCILFDDICSCPGKVIKQLYRFIGVDENFVPDSASGKIYSSHTYKSREIEKILNASSMIIRKFFGRLFHRAIIRTNIPNRIRSHNKKMFDDTTVPLLTKDEKRIIWDILSKDINCLSHLIGRDLSMWKLSCV